MLLHSDMFSVLKVTMVYNNLGFISCVLATQLLSVMISYDNIAKNRSNRETRVVLKKELAVTRKLD